MNASKKKLSISLRTSKSEKAKLCHDNDFDPKKDVKPIASINSAVLRN